MKRLLTILCLLTAFGLRAADSTIVNLGAISTVPDTYVTVWENPGVSDVKITFLNLTNQVLAGYLSLGYANTLYDVLGAGTTAAHNATNNFPWGVLYDASGAGATAAYNATNGLGGLAAFKAVGYFDVNGAGVTAAQNATNTFPWGVLYDPINAAFNATNSMGSLAAFKAVGYFDVAGAGTTAALNATNGFPWGVLYDASGAGATAAYNATNTMGGLAAFKATSYFDLAGAGTTAAFNATNNFPWLALSATLAQLQGATNTATLALQGLAQTNVAQTWGQPQTFTGNVTGPNFNTATNSATQNIDLSKAYSDFQTNAAFAWLGFQNKSTTTYQTAVIHVWDTTGTVGGHAITWPANTIVQGTSYVTNHSVCTVWYDPAMGGLTNAIVWPLN